MSTHIENIEHIENAHFHNSSEKPPLPSNIPSPKGFIGRVDELNQLQTAKESGKTAFVLHGAGGVGKTDLALEFIRRNKAGYQAGIRVDMQGLSDKPLPPNAAKLEIIRAFEPQVPADLSETDINNLYESLLNQHRTILFFDNARDRAQVESLNDASALVVITSRETFNVSGGFGKEIEQMLPADARQLLYSMADETRFDGQADDLAYLAGYLPMALLPLAALLVGDITLEAADLVRRYADRQERLRLADPNRENLSVEASFDLSYDTLRDELQTFWRKLAVFPADFDLEAMQFVWQIESGTAIRAELVAKHLLEYNGKTKRSKLHDLARDYANEKLDESERFQTEYAYCYYYGLFLASLNKVTLENLEKFDIERINIEHGFSSIKSIIKTNPTAPEFVYVCLDYLLYTKSILFLKLHSRVLIEWQETGLVASKIINSLELESQFYGALGQIYESLGGYQDSIFNYEKGLSIAKEHGYLEIESNHLGDLGVTYLNLFRFSEALLCFEKSLEIKKTIKDKIGESKQLLNIGNCFLYSTQYNTSLEFYKEALEIVREVNHIKDEGLLLGNIGNVLCYLGNFDDSVTYSRQGLEIAKKIGDLEGQTRCNLYLGNAFSRKSEYKSAIKYYEESLQTSIQIEFTRGIGDALGNLGNVYYLLSEIIKAKDYYLRALAIFEGLGLPEAKLVRQNLAMLE